MLCSKCKHKHYDYADNCMECDLFEYEFPEECQRKDEEISPFLPEGARLSVDKNGYVHIRGMKGEQLDAPYESFKDDKDEE